MTGPTRRLRYRDPQGRFVEARVMAECDDPSGTGPPLRAALVRLELPDAIRSARMVSVPAGAPCAAYELLDNEVLAGLRLMRLGGSGGGHGGLRQVSGIIGHDADAAEPFVLLTPYEGEPVAEVVGGVLSRDRLRFQVSLLTGVCLVAAAGIAHRGLGPHTVRWNGEFIQITDFTQSTLIGAPRTVVGGPPWWAPEQRPDLVRDEVTDRDDIWAAARLIHYVLTGRELQARTDLDEVAELAPLRDRILGPPESRPTARELLRALGAAAPMPRGTNTDPSFEEGLAQFMTYRRRKHGLNASAPTSHEADVGPTVEMDRAAVMTDRWQEHRGAAPSASETAPPARSGEPERLADEPQASAEPVRPFPARPRVGTRLGLALIVLMVAAILIVMLGMRR